MQIAKYRRHMCLQCIGILRVHITKSTQVHCSQVQNFDARIFILLASFNDHLGIDNAEIIEFPNRSVAANNIHDICTTSQPTYETTPYTALLWVHDIFRYYDVVCCLVILVW